MPTVQPTVKLGPAAATTTTKSSTQHVGQLDHEDDRETHGRTASPTSSTATSTGSTPVGTSTADSAAGGALPGDPPDSGGSPWPLVGAGSAIALIIVGAVAVSLRRRGVGGT